MRNLWPFIAVAAWVVAINELSSALVRHFFGLDHALWVLKPVLFVVHVENSQGTVALSGPIGKQIYGIVAFVSLGVATWALSRHEDAAFCRHRLGIGLLIGGILADGYQLLIVGSVTDFIGVRPFGLIGLRQPSAAFSFADLAIASGIVISGVPSKLDGIRTLISRVTGRRGR